MDSLRRLRFAFAGLFVPVCAVLVLQAGALHFTTTREENLAVPGLQKLPADLGPWRVADEQELEKYATDALKPDEYVLRDYVNAATDSSINLFVVYFRSLQNTYGPHSPKFCLPGSGWLELSSKVASIPVAGRPSGLPVNEYVLEKSGERIVVVYWYQNNRNVWAREFRAKLYFLPDLLRYQRSDVSLVRLVTPVGPSGQKAALSSCVRFAQLLFPDLVKRFAQTS